MLFRKVMVLVALSSAGGLAAEPPKPGAERDVEMSNGVKMRFCWIPAGKSTLGLKPGERTNLDTADLDAYPFETKGFWLGKYEVTQAEWEGVMGANPSHFRAGGEGAAKVRGLKTDRFPVEMVSFKDCQKFIEAAGVKGLRLPHEDEWEYACRGGLGNKQAFYFGDEATSKQFNFDGGYGYHTKEKGPYLARTTAVGSYAKVAPHPWGLCDMHGNVWEWCSNVYTRNLERRCLRGGSWNNPGRAGRSAFRNGDYPDYASQTIGVRFCLD